MLTPLTAQKIVTEQSFLQSHGSAGIESFAALLYIHVTGIDMFEP